MFYIMNKDEIIKRIDEESYSSIKEIRQWIDTMTCCLPNPSKYRKGDVFTFSDNNKKRPFVIVKQVKNTIIAIPLTTTEDELSLGSYDSRFFGVGYFSKSIITLKTEHIKDKLIGFLEDNKSLNNAYNKIKNVI